MNLNQLKEEVDRAIEAAKEQGRNPDEIPVSLQIHMPEGPVWSDEGIALIEDGGCLASGAVLIAEGGQRDS